MASAVFFRTASAAAVLSLAIGQSSVVLAQTAPPINNTDCATLTSADIGGTSVITLDGSNVTSWDVIYNGVNTNIEPSAPEFPIQPIVGSAVDVQINANGFDGMNPVSDSITCPIPFNAPSCTASQDPDSTVTPVDVGTVITLTLITTNAVSATVDSVPMSVLSGIPDIDFDVTWEATTTAVENNLLTGTAVGPDGQSVDCTWDIQVNDQPPSPPSITQPADGSTVFVQGQVTDEFLVDWTESTDPDGDLVSYEWTLAADADFSTVLLNIGGLPDTGVALSFGAVADLLSANGVAPGQSITLFHRATAVTEFISTEGPAAEVTLALGIVSDSDSALPIPTLGSWALGLLAALLAVLAFFGIRANRQKTMVS